MADQQTIFKADDLVVSGNLTVRGTQDVITTTETDLNIKDRLITLNKGGTLGTNVAGFEIESGGGIVATLGYTTASGFDLGNKNITTTGTIAGNFALATDSVNDTHIDWYDSGNPQANQISTADVPENINLYYTIARFDTQFATKTTNDLAQGSNLYYTTTQANTDIDARIATTSINTMLDVDTTSTPPTNGQALAWNTTKWEPVTITGHTNTTTLTEGTNLYFTPANFTAAGISIDSLGDVVTTGAGASDIGKVLMWSGTEWQHNAMSVGVAKAVKGTFASNLVHTSTSAGAGGDHGTIVVTGPLVNYTAGTGKILVSFDINVTQSHPHTNVTGSNFLNKLEIRVHKAINGNALSNYGTPIHTLQVMSWEEYVSIQFIDDGSVVGHGAAPHGVTYHITTNTINASAYDGDGNGPATSTITIPAGGLLGHAIELNTDPLDELEELTDTIITTPASNQMFQYNGAQWQNTSWKINTSGIATNNILKWDGVDSFVTSDMSNMVSLNQLTDVDTTGIVDDAIIKYDLATASWKIATDVDTGIVNIVEDTSPQLGGNLDINGNSIISTGTDDIAITPAAGKAVIVTGDLTVTGTATTMDVQNITVEDQLMILNKADPVVTNNANDIGIVMRRGTDDEVAPKGDNVAMIWDESEDEFAFGYTAATGAETGAITLTDYATIHATATSAQYADLAEMYISDSSYEAGTVVIFGGDKEVTQSTMFTDHRVAGVVSNKPAYLMNKDAVAGNPHLEAVAVALRGKVPCKIDGPIKKGDIIVTGTQPGTGTGLANDSAMPNAVCVIGKSIEDNSDTGVRLINIVV